MEFISRMLIIVLTLTTNRPEGLNKMTQLITLTAYAGHGFELDMSGHVDLDQIKKESAHNGITHPVEMMAIAREILKQNLTDPAKYAVSYEIATPNTRLTTGDGTVLTRSLEIIRNPVQPYPKGELIPSKSIWRILADSRITSLTT